MDGFFNWVSDIIEGPEEKQRTGLAALIQRLESPEPFEDWAVAEQKTNVPDVITTQDNRFRLLVHWLGEGCVWLKDGNSAMERFGLDEYGNCTCVLDAADKQAILAALAFIKSDKPPEISWSSITNLDELMVGVKYTDDGCSAEWNSTIGVVARKNKMAFGIVKKNDTLSLARQDLTTILQGITQKNLSPALSRQIQNMTLAAGVRQQNTPTNGSSKKE